MGDAHRVGEREHDAVEEVGDDAGEDQQGHAVADTVLGDTLTDPHRQGSAASHDDADGHITEEVLVRRIEHVAGLLQAGDDADGLQGS